MKQSRAAAVLLLCLLAGPLGVARSNAGLAQAPYAGNLLFVRLPQNVPGQNVAALRPLVREQLDGLRWRGGETGGLDAVVIVTDDDGRPIGPDQIASPGVNQLQFSFESPDYPWEGDELATLMQAVDDLYPLIVDVYGEPAFTTLVNFRKDPTIPYAGYYVTYPTEIVLADPAQIDVVVHELLHAFRGHLLLPLQTFEEGMARAAEIEVLDRSAAYSAWTEHHKYTYDVYYEALNRPIIGSQDGIFSNTTLALLHYQLTGYAWGKAVLENGRFFVDFNQALYRVAYDDRSVLDDEERLVAMAAAAQPTVEGQAFRAWYHQQGALNTQPPTGCFLYQRIDGFVVDYFCRDASGWETSQGDATVHWAVYDYRDVLLAEGSAVTTAKGWASFYDNILPILATHPGRIKAVVSTAGPNGVLTDTAVRDAFNSGGVFGVTPDYEAGTVEITGVDGATLSLALDKGQFDAPALARARGRLLAVFNAPDGSRFSRYFTKDASQYFVHLARPASAGTETPTPTPTATATTTQSPTPAPLYLPLLLRVR